MTYRTALFATWLALGAGVIGYAFATVQAPNTLAGCQYNATPPTLTDGQLVTLQCDSSGNLKTKAQ
jgi:hypothetical protein